MRKSILTTLAGLALFSAASLRAEGDNFNYKFDDAPLKKHEKQAAEWQNLREAGLNKPASEKDLRRQLTLIEEISKAEPEWIDGYWLVGEDAFQLANSLTKPEQSKEARAIFVQGQDATETCLKKAPDNPLCKLFLGAAIGKIASIDGIFSSLKKAERIETLWLQVTNSGVNYRTSPYSTLQGSTRYALGLFYRLVPDMAMIKWLFGVRGDIQKSIAFHKGAVEADGQNTCNVMMLGVSTLCAAKGDAKSKEGQDGLKLLADAKALPVVNAMTKTCAADIPKLEKDPSLACGYETSRQQDQSEEELKKVTADNK